MCWRNQQTAKEAAAPWPCLAPATPTAPLPPACSFVNPGKTHVSESRCSCDNDKEAYKDLRRRLQVEGGAQGDGGADSGSCLVITFTCCLLSLLSSVVLCVWCVWCVRRRCNAFNKQDDVALDDDCSARGLLCSALAAALEPPLIPLHPLLPSWPRAPAAQTRLQPRAP